MRRLLVICCVLLLSVGFFMVGCEKKDAPPAGAEDAVEAPAEADHPAGDHPEGDHPAKEETPAP